MNGEEINSSSPSSLALFSWYLALLPFSNQFCCKVGFRFCPNDEQIIDHYLKKKIQEDPEVDEAIAEVDVLKFEPWDLPSFSKEKSKDQIWYFFNQLDYKYLNKKLVSRKTAAGYWKATGKDRKVRSRDTQQIIGIKKTLVFYISNKKVKSLRTNWVIHEYHITVTADLPNPKAYVICRLEKKAEGKVSTLTPDENQSSRQSPSDFGNRVAENTVLEVNPPSQADPEAIISCDELDYDLFSELMAQLYEQDQDLPNDCNGVQTQFDITEPASSNSFNSDCNGVQTQFGTTEPPSSNSFSSDCNGVQTQLGILESPPSNSCNSDCNGVQTQLGTLEAPPSNSFNNDCNGVQTQFGTTEPPSSISFYNGVQTQFGTHEQGEDFGFFDSFLDIESEDVSLNWDVDGMSLAHVLESLRGTSCNGGMISDTNHEVAIAQAAVDIATDMRSSWNIFPDDTSQLSHKTVLQQTNADLLTVPIINV